MIRESCAALVAAILAITPALAADAKPGSSRLPAFECRLLATEHESSFDVLPEDWNGDGRADILISHGNAGLLTLYTGGGERQFDQGKAIKVGRVPRGIAVADLTGDGILDAVVGNALSNDTVVVAGDGRGGFEVHQTFRGMLSPFQPEIADFDGDSHLDLAVANESNVGLKGSAGVVNLFFGDGKGKLTGRKDLIAGIRPADVEAADVNRDGNLDLLAINWGAGSLSVFLNRGSRSFEHIEIPLGIGPSYSIYAADLDGDGLIDIAATDLEASKVWIIKGDGRGGFGEKRGLATGVGVRCVTGADINSDGLLDLLTANTKDGDISILLGKPEGGFADAISIAVAPHPRMVRARDLDADGRLDLVVSSLASSDVTLLFQTTDSPRPCPTANPPAGGSPP